MYIIYIINSVGTYMTGGGWTDVLPNGGGVGYRFRQSLMAARRSALDFGSHSVMVYYITGSHGQG